jgi:hypothetical protein
MGSNSAEFLAGIGVGKLVILVKKGGDASKTRQAAECLKETLEQAGKNTVDDIANAADDVVDLGKNAKPKGGTYKLKDPETGRVRRTGRTNDLDRRMAEHRSDLKTKDLKFEVDRRTDNYAQQRGREQIIYDQHPGADLNKNRPIDPRNPNKKKYMDAAKEIE